MRLSCLWDIDLRMTTFSVQQSNVRAKWAVKYAAYLEQALPYFCAELRSPSDLQTRAISSADAESPGSVSVSTPKVRALGFCLSSWSAKNASAGSTSRSTRPVGYHLSAQGRQTCVSRWTSLRIWYGQPCIWYLLP